MNQTVSIVLNALASARRWLISVILFVRADPTIELTPAVTVPAQNLKTRRIALSTKQSAYVVTFGCTFMLTTSAVYVVDSKKLRLGFAAASTFAAIMTNGIGAVLMVALKITWALSSSQLI